MRRWALAAVLSALTPVWDADAAAQELRVVRADLVEGETSLVAYDPFSEIDWAALARARFDRFDIDAPPPAVLREHWNEVGHVSRFTYRAPLPAGLAGAHRYFVTGLGVLSVEPVALRGTVRYDVGPDGTDASAPRFYGVVLARTGGVPVTAPGFVLASDDALSVGTASVDLVGREEARGARIEARETDDGRVSVFIDGSGTERRVPFEPGYPLPVEAYTIRTGFGGGDRYLFVQHGADEACRFACCRYAMQLLRIDAAELTELAANLAACDV